MKNNIVQILIANYIVLIALCSAEDSFQIQQNITGIQLGNLKEIHALKFSEINNKYSKQKVLKIPINTSRDELGFQQLTNFNVTDLKHDFKVKESSLAFMNGNASKTDAAFFSNKPRTLITITENSTARKSNTYFKMSSVNFKPFSRILHNKTSEVSHTKDSGGLVNYSGTKTRKIRNSEHFNDFNIVATNSSKSEDYSYMNKRTLKELPKTVYEKWRRDTMLGYRKWWLPEAKNESKLETTHVEEKPELKKFSLGSEHINSSFILSNFSHNRNLEINFTNIEYDDYQLPNQSSESLDSRNDKLDINTENHSYFNEATNSVNDVRLKPPLRSDFSAEAILKIIKRERNIQVKILNELVLYLPVLFCDILLLVACWKFLSQIFVQIALIDNPDEYMNSPKCDLNFDGKIDTRPTPLRQYAGHTTPFHNDDNDGDDTQAAAIILSDSNDQRSTVKPRERNWFPPS